MQGIKCWLIFLDGACNSLNVGHKICILNENLNDEGKEVK
jgi:hypothetical protein